MTSLGIVGRSLLSRPVRTGVTAFSVAVMTAVTVVTLSLLSPVHELVRHFQEHPALLTKAKYFGSVPTSDAEFISKIDGVKDVHWFNYTEGAIDLPGNQKAHFLLQVLSPKNLDMMQAEEPWFSYVAPEALTAFDESRNALVVSHDLLVAAGWNRGQRVVLDTGFGKVDGVIAGEWSGQYVKGQPIVGMHEEYLGEIAPEQRGRAITIGYYVPADAAKQAEIAREVDARFAGSEQPTLTVSRAAYQDVMWVRPMTTVPLLLWRVALMMIVVTTVVTMSTVAMNLRERRADFGILRALGFSQGRVYFLVIVESLGTCLLGGVLGALLPFVATSAKDFHIGDQALIVPPLVALLGIALAVVVAVLSALLPAYQTVRTDVIKALGAA